MFDLTDLRAKLAAEHRETPQRAAMAQIALDTIEGGLHQLEALGHRFSVGEMEPEAALVFPKAMYMDGQPYREVHSSDELKAALKDGWREHPSEDGPVGPRPNGEQGPKTRLRVLDEVMRHPMSQSLATGKGEPLTPSGPGYGYLRGKDDAVAGFVYVRGEDDRVPRALKLKPGHPKPLPGLAKTEKKAHVQAEAKTDAALKSERGYESEAEEQKHFEEDEAAKPKPRGHR